MTVLINNWPSSEAGRLKFVVDLYFDTTNSEEDKLAILLEQDSKYFQFYQYLKENFPLKKENNSLKINLLPKKHLPTDI